MSVNIDFDITEQLDALKKSIVIERYTVTRGNYENQAQTTWSTHLTIDATIQTLQGSEVIVSDKNGVMASLRMFCKPADITEKDRVKYNGKYYKIYFVTDPMLQSKFYEILLERSDNYGANSV